MNLWTKDVPADERHPGAAERHPAGAFDLPSDVVPASTDSPHPWRSRLVTAALVILFWLAYFAGVSMMVHFGNPEETRDLYTPRALVAASGVLISFGLLAVQSRLAHATLGRRALVAVAMALLAPIPHWAINTLIFNYYFPRESPSLGFVEFASDYSWRLWIWCAMSGTILAMSYAADIRERERRIIALQALAHSAQMRALRLQLNPHFLFNALNSVAGLISTRRVEEAERMTENLADFLRQTLALDPQKLITLGEELQLQSLYLEIEKKRFPKRLKVEVDVPETLHDVLVPSLVTQPLIENSIKYAVARSKRPVVLTISARERGKDLELIVEDDGGDAVAAPQKGAHLGLRNVAERIAAHYGDRGRFTSWRSPSGGFCNRIKMPLERFE